MGPLRPSGRSRRSTRKIIPSAVSSSMAARHPPGQLGVVLVQRSLARPRPRRRSNRSSRRRCPTRSSAPRRPASPSPSPRTGRRRRSSVARLAQLARQRGVAKARPPLRGRRRRTPTARAPPPRSSPSRARARPRRRSRPPHEPQPTLQIGEVAAPAVAVRTSGDDRGRLGPPQPGIGRQRRTAPTSASNSSGRKSPLPRIAASRHASGSSAADRPARLENRARRTFDFGPVSTSTTDPHITDPPGRG